MDANSETHLLQGARRFDLACLGEIYDLYSPAVFAYASRLLGSADLAEECVSETFSRFLKILKAGQGPDSFLQAYLFRIAHNWITDYYRRQPPPPFELDEHLRGDEDERPERQVEERLEQERIRTALRGLTPDQRQVIVLRFIEGWGNDQVSAAVQKPVSAVKALQHRALAALRRMLWMEEGEKPNA